ncbi:MAG TPA: alkaline phosphatase family protein [Candidatus Acidoferrales bacterium]|nr:alkaline phosphatase family protein [Candidatus Acidoferrales bacterium]
MRVRVLGLVLAIAAGAVACSGSTNSFGAPVDLQPPAPNAELEPALVGGRFGHVVIVVQENRTFDNLFATFPGADGTLKGLTHTGAWIPLVPHSLHSTVAPDNPHRQWVEDYDRGKMDGFDVVGVCCGWPKTYVYQYVKPSDIKAYWFIASHYVLADHMFQTQGSGSFTAHQDLIRGGTEISPTRSLIDFPTNLPWGCDAPQGTVTSLIALHEGYLADRGPFPCMSYSTLRDLLDAKGVSWKYYAPVFESDWASEIWNAFDGIKVVRYGPEWRTNVSMPSTNFFKDVRSGNLPDVSWVIPDFNYSDHPGCTGCPDLGPQWVASIVNAIGESQYWNDTAVIIVWDDWGGWYDHVKPPQLDYQGLGFRVPMLMVAPYALDGVVVHTQYEFGSIIRFVEDNWSLGRLGTTDVRARNILDAFDFQQSPRPFVPIPTRSTPSPSPTPVQTPTPTPTPSFAPTATPSPTPVASPTASV